MEAVIDVASEVLCGMAVSWLEKEVPLDTDVGRYVARQRYITFGRFIADGNKAASRVLVFFRKLFEADLKPVFRYMAERRFISNFFIEDVDKELKVAVLYPIHTKAAGKISGLANGVIIEAAFIEAIACVEAVEERGRVRALNKRVVYPEDPLNYVREAVEKYLEGYFEDIHLYTTEKV